MSHLDGEWVREARRLHERYLVEIVEELGLCPWARATRVGGAAPVAVVLATGDEAVARSAALLGEWEAAGVEIGFLVYPRVRLGRHEFDRLAASLRLAVPSVGTPHFALAAFHPEAEPVLDDAERLIPFLRRTADPCVQAVCGAALERVRRGPQGGTQFIDARALEAALSAEPVPPPLRDRIASANLETVRRAGVDAVRARLEDIVRDRERTYGALEAREASSPPPPGLAARR